MLLHAAALLVVHSSVQEKHRRNVRRIGIPLLLLLDLPFAYLQIVYKSWHPDPIDAIWSAFVPIWTILQFNGLIATLVILIRAGLAAVMKTTMMKRVPKMTITKQRMKRPDGEADGVAGRRRFLKGAGLVLGGTMANVGFLAAADGDEDRKIERVKIRVPGLPEEFLGLTIGMASDVHSSPFMGPDQMRLYADALNSLEADLIVMTGDFVNSKVREVYPCAEAFSDLSAPMGVYGVTGNHDYYSRDVDRVVRELDDAGIRMLINENVLLKKGESELRLLGVDEDALYDIREYNERGETSRGATENLFAGVDRSTTSILLAHKPYTFEDYAEAGVDLALSGHTHGGQIVLGASDRMRVSIASLASGYISGLYRSRSSTAQMYISRGIGYTGIPVRINCPPEITHIQLV